MLQAQMIQQLLLKLLEPAPELTSVLPISVSLISLDRQKPLLSCISKAAMEQDKLDKENNDSVNDLNQQPNLDSSARVESNEHMSLLNPTDLGNDINNYSSNIRENDNNNSADSNDLLSAKSRIDELQRQIDLMNENYNSDYINANVNPIDNLNILSLMVVREWKQDSRDNNIWKVYSFGKYRLFMYYVNEKYTLLLCTTMDYPSIIAISRLKDVSSILSKRI